jgi:hypothetical protein
MHYSELQFILAELAFKGIITGNAQAYYEKGVQSAIEQWGLTMPAIFDRSQCYIQQYFRKNYASEIPCSFLRRWTAVV